MAAEEFWFQSQLFTLLFKTDFVLLTQTTLGFVSIKARLPPCIPWSLLKMGSGGEGTVHIWLEVPA